MNPNHENSNEPAATSGAASPGTSGAASPGTSGAASPGGNLNELQLSPSEMPHYVDPVTEAPENLILMGGGDYSHLSPCIAKFVELAGATDAELLAIPWASSDPGKYLKTFYDAVSPYEPASIEFAPLREQMGDPAWKQDFLTKIEKATGIFFIGGDQSDFMNVLCDPDILEALNKKLHAGVVFAGTSAGTAVMSLDMLNGKGSGEQGEDGLTEVDPAKVGVGQGFGALVRPITDQHFFYRNRWARLFSALMKTERPIGIGVDEESAAYIDKTNILRVMGPGQVTIIRQKYTDPNSFEVTILNVGQGYDLERNVALRTDMSTVPNKFPEGPTRNSKKVESGDADPPFEEGR